MSTVLPATEATWYMSLAVEESKYYSRQLDYDSKKTVNGGNYAANTYLFTNTGGLKLNM